MGSSLAEMEEETQRTHGIMLAGDKLEAGYRLSIVSRAQLAERGGESMARILVCTMGLLLGMSTLAWGFGYGAIAYDRASAHWGTSYGFASQEAANDSALRECRKHTAYCEIVVRFWGDTCAAYAIGSNGAGWGSGASRQRAERNALAACGEHGEVCQVQVWACNPMSPPVGGPSWTGGAKNGSSFQYVCHWVEAGWGKPAHSECHFE